MAGDVVACGCEWSREVETSNVCLAGSRMHVGGTGA